MAKDIIRMAGSFEFHTFAYLWNNAQFFLGRAENEPSGAGINCVSAALHCAFTIEAFLNHIGEGRVRSWSLIEKGLGIKSKLEVIASEIGFTLDWGSRPLQTVSGLLLLRNHIAHGKTYRDRDDAYEYDRQSNRGDCSMMPGWLKRYTELSEAQRAIDDTRALWELLCEKAGTDPVAIALVSRAFYAEQR